MEEAWTAVDRYVIADHIPSSAIRIVWHEVRHAFLWPGLVYAGLIAWGICVEWRNLDHWPTVGVFLIAIAVTLFEAYGLSQLLNRCDGTKSHRDDVP